MRKSLGRQHQFPATTYDLRSLSSFVSWDGKFLRAQEMFLASAAHTEVGCIWRGVSLLYIEMCRGRKHAKIGLYTFDKDKIPYQPPIHTREYLNTEDLEIVTVKDSEHVPVMCGVLRSLSRDIKSSSILAVAR
jgi:hypothetical protein